MIIICNEPKELVYEKLLDLAFNTCSYFTLVERHQLKLNSKGNKILNLLNKDLIEVKIENEWPGTYLINHYANVYYFKATDYTKLTLKQNSSSLYSWISPDYPEDLCFFKDNGNVWLTTISHEKSSYFNINCEKEKLSIQSISNLKIKMK